MEEKELSKDPIARAMLPVGRSGWAIAAGYAGLFSIILIFAPLAIVFSFLAFKDLKNHPEKFGKGRAIFGLVLGILGTLGLIFYLYINYFPFNY